MPLTRPYTRPDGLISVARLLHARDQGYLVSLNIHQRLTRIIPDATGRQALWLPVQPFDAVSEVLTLLDPVFAHYAAQWPRIMTGMEEDEFGRGFFLEGEDLPEQIADPSQADELDVIAWRNIPPETRREGRGFGWRPPARPHDRSSRGRAGYLYEPLRSPRRGWHRAVRRVAAEQQMYAAEA
jgi:hypothetical protein